MQEMAESGAKVLHARAVEFAKQRNIAILARKTDDFTHGGQGRETRVHAQAAGNPRAVVVEGRSPGSAAPPAARSLLNACSDAELTLRDSAYATHVQRLLPLSGVASVDATLAAPIQSSRAEDPPGVGHGCSVASAQAQKALTRSRRSGRPWRAPAALFATRAARHGAPRRRGPLRREARPPLAPLRRLAALACRRVWRQRGGIRGPARRHAAKGARRGARWR